MFAASLVTINLALAWYTLGVWAERVQRVLRGWHVVCFGLGLASDATGTYLMTRIATTDLVDGVPTGGLVELMGWTGTLAIVLMAVHFAWALVVLVRNRPGELASFHRFSVVVWAIWLVPYLAGAASAMLR